MVPGGRGEAKKGVAGEGERQNSLVVYPVGQGTRTHKATGNRT